MKFYLITAEVSKEAYSIDNRLFNIFTTREDAIQWIKDNRKIKINTWGKTYTFDFLSKKSLCSGNKEWTDDLIYERYIEEFDPGNDEPLIIGAYIE